ncbi:hypothetical protein [Blastococcus montanus]|uniref:hypothetical protein n=1 Tax=Blastococcus montanus TaxID=3144973 RepID=UPI00320A22FC
MALSTAAAATSEHVDVKKSVLVLVVGAAAAVLTACGGSAADKADTAAAAVVTAEQPDPETLMFEACVEDVTPLLKAPLTAVFPDPPTARYETPDPSGYHDVRVYSYVDSQNGFGALIRSEWSCSVSMSADGTQVTDLGRIVVGGRQFF